jgi:hypothetical protein
MKKTFTSSRPGFDFSHMVIAMLAMLMRPQTNQAAREDKA